MAHPIRGEGGGRECRNTRAGAVRPTQAYSPLASLIYFKGGPVDEVVARVALAHGCTDEQARGPGGQRAGGCLEAGALLGGPQEG